MKRTTQAVAPVVPQGTEVPFDPDFAPENGDGAHADAQAEWLWLLWDKRRFLWRVTVRGLVLATLVAFLIPKRFDSTTRLMPPDQQSGSGLAMLAAMTGKAGAGLGNVIGLGNGVSDLLGMKSSGDLFLDILRARTVQDRLIQRFDLRKVYWDRYWEDARKDLAENTDLSEDRKSGVISITVNDRDPHRAQRLAQAYVEELDRLVAEVSTSSARRERIFIEARLQNVKQDLDNASREFSQYASQNSTIDITAQAKATVEAAARLEGELIAAQSELEGLEQIYTPNNVRVRSLRARVQELRHQLHQLGGDTAAPPTDITSSTNNTSADPKPQLEFPSIRQLPLLGVRWADLYRQTKIEETVYELLTQQYELAKIQEAKEIPVVKVLDAANAPEKKASPHRLLIIVLSTILALVVGVAWVLGNAAWGEIAPSDPRKILAQEVSGALKRKMEPWQARSRGLSRGWPARPPEEGGADARR